MTDYAKTKVQRFRKQFQRRYGDGHYFFACHAAFPIAFTVDMLYQLWANFKDVPAEAVDKAESLLPLKSRTIDRLAVSDLVQSGLCRPTDGDLFEMETEVRVYLLQQLETYFSGERLDELARFSFQYTDRRIKDPYYRAFRDTQKWVSLARLAPEKAGEQLAAYYNLMVEADNAAEIARLDALLQALTLMDARFSDLREFSRAIRATYSAQSEDEKLETAREAFKKVVRIRSEVADKAGGIKVQLHDRLKQQTFEFKEEIKDEGQVLRHRLNQSQDKGALELDLSGMDLTSVPEEVFRQTSLEKLDLSNNQISALPEALGYLKNLKQLILDRNKIEELPGVLAELSELEVFSLKGNRIDFLPDWIMDFQKLQRLDVRGNPVKNIRQDKLLFEQPADFRVLDWFFKPQPLGFNQPMVMILITDPSEREIVLRALEPVVDSGQLHIEFPEEIKPWQLFRLFRQFDREQICMLHVNGYDSEDVFAYGIGPDTHSVSFRVWKGIIGQVPEGKMCFLSSGTSNRMVEQMLDLGFDACFSADTFQSEGDESEAYMDRLYRSLGNGRSLREAEAYAREPFDPSQQEQMVQQKAAPLVGDNLPYQMDIRSEEALEWRMLELDIPKSFASLDEMKAWAEERLLSGGPGAVFTPLREMLLDYSDMKKGLEELQTAWEQQRSEEARRSFYESEESPMRNFVRAIQEEDLVVGLIAPQGSTSWFLGIGISKHLQLPDIRNAVNDVLEMQRTLEEKYELDESTLLFDEEATTESILKNLEELLDRVGPADQVLIYYCGHTELDESSDRGYWLPFDAEANRRSSYLDNNTIIDYIRNISCKDLLLIVDGVFSGALFEGSQSSAAQSYTEPSAGVSRWGLVSGQDKGTVEDGPPARFSPFADSILEVLKWNTEPQLEIEELAVRTTKSMMSRAAARQTPAFGPLWGAGHGEGQYVFRLKSKGEEGTKAADFSGADKKAAPKKKNKGSLKTDEEDENLDPLIKKLQADMALVEGGTFTMGWLNKERDGEGNDNEKPAHEVTLDDFYIGRYPVTQAQWRAVMGSDPPKLSNKGCDDCPVESVSWNGVQDFIQQLNKLTSQSYRLPTEAEWEFAARGGNHSQGYLYSGSHDLDEVGWYGDNSNLKTHPVGKKKANELGLFDMSGNVWEWCRDWYGDYPSAAQLNPKGPESGSFRVIHGGGWYDYPQYCRAANRRGDGPAARRTSIGFRLARD